MPFCLLDHVVLYRSENSDFNHLKCNNSSKESLLKEHWIIEFCPSASYMVLLFNPFLLPLNVLCLETSFHISYFFCSFWQFFSKCVTPANALLLLCGWASLFLERSSFLENCSNAADFFSERIQDSLRQWNTFPFYLPPFLALLFLLPSLPFFVPWLSQ